MNIKLGVQRTKLVYIPILSLNVINYGRLQQEGAGGGGTYAPIYTIKIIIKKLPLSKRQMQTLIYTGISAPMINPFIFWSLAYYVTIKW